jgi:hypothetical protein
MKYTIISRDEFLKLIKFGTIYQNINYIVEEKNQQKVISEILKALPYDDPFGYVVVEFTYEENFSISYMQTLVKLDIKDIINIYCLTNEALDFYKSKFNPNIKFKLFENQDLIKEVNFHKLIEDKKQGIEVLFEIFKLNLKDVNEKYNDNLIKELLEFEENNYLEQEYKNFYFDLFCYKRYNSFYKEDIGFLSDIRALNQMVDIRLQKEIFLSGTYTNNIITNKEKNAIELKLINIISKYIEMSNKNDEKTEEEKKETIRESVIGAIFLKSRQLLNTESREENYWENFENLINEFKKEFLEETKEALWYLGVFLGYKYLYDDYYNFSNFNIFKENDLSDVLINEKEEDLENSIQNNNVDSENIQDKNSSNQSNLINQIKEENEQLKKQLEEKVQSEKELKEEIERKNQELLNQAQYSKKNENQKNFVEVYELAEICTQEDENISRETNDNQMIDLNTLPIESLREIFYRRDTKNNKLSDLKEKYNENNKQELIKKILSSSLKI